MFNGFGRFSTNIIKNINYTDNKFSQSDAETLMTSDIYTDEKLAQIKFDVVRKLHDERLKQNLSTYDLELFTDIDKGTIYRLERMQRNIGIDTLIKLCHALNLNLDDVYKIYPEPEYKKRKHQEKIINLIKDLTDEDFHKLENYIKKLQAETLLGEEISF